LTKCGTECVDIQNDEANCGMCGTVCAPSIACFNGTCAAAGACDAAMDCNTCQTCAFDGVCLDELQSCALDANCVNLVNCVNACPANDPMCPNTCGQMYPNGIDGYNNLVNCLFCQECTTSCGIDTVAFGCPASCDGTNDCNTCIQCSIGTGGLCEDDLFICAVNPECVALSDCFNLCPAGDQTCQDTCAQMHVSGVADYNALSICAICQECSGDCNQGMACP
jgi:hypothetical protein